MAGRLAADCATVEIDVTAQTHAFRRGFKTIAVGHGAAEVWIERVIHNAAGGVDAGYLKDSWPAMCAAVSCIPISAPKLATVTVLRTASGGSSGGREATLEATLDENGPVSLAKQASGLSSRRFDPNGSSQIPPIGTIKGSRRNGRIASETTQPMQTVTQVAAKAAPSPVETLRAMLAASTSEGERVALTAALAALGAAS